jgi:hypothetical protein
MPFPAAPTTGSGVEHWGGSTAPPPSGVKTRSIPFDKEIVDWEKDLFPSATIVMRENSITKASPRWIRWEKKPFPHWASAVSEIAAATTDFTTGFANHLTRFTQHDVWKVEDTGEMIVFNGATAATSYDDVDRGVGSVPAAIIPAGAKIYKVGTAFPTGSTAPTAHYVLEDEITFYGTEHMVSVESDSHILVTKFPAEANRHAAAREARRMEFTEILKRSYFGSLQAQVVQAAGGHTQTVKGLDDHVSTWTYNFGGILTKPDFTGFIGDGPGRYIRGDIGIACSSFVMNIANNWMAEIATADQSKDEDTLGFDVRNLRLVAGRRAKLFYESWLDESPTMQGRFYVFPLNKKQGSRYVTCSGPELDGKVQLKKNIKTEDAYTGKKDVWYAFYGWDHGPEIGYGIGSGIEG